MIIDIRQLRNVWHVSCPELGDSTTVGSFSEAVLWGTIHMEPGDEVTIRLQA